MATAYVAEFEDPPISKKDSAQMVPLASHPALAQQTVTYTSSAQSAAFNARTRMIRIIANAECRYLVGADPAAVAGSNLLPANTIEYLAVTPGQKIAFYDGST